MPYTLGALLADFVLLIVLCVVVALVVTVVMHVFLQVPYVPTPRRIAKQMVALADLRPGDRVYDLGAGDGRVLFAAKRLHPQITAVGCEVVPTVWLLSLVCRFFARQQVTLHLKSAQAEDLHSADVLLLYVTPSLLRTLLPKFRRELRPGTRIVSHAFRLPGLEPVRTAVLKRRFHETSLYVYRW